MAVDSHLKLDGVEGESTHKDHKGEIELQSWQWQVDQPSEAFGGGSGKGKAHPGVFSFMHHYDKASPTLAKNCASGKHFKDAVVTTRKAGEGQKDFLKITMKEVFVVHVSPNGSSGGDIMESVSMSYKDIEFDYKPQDEKGGLGGSVKFGWNVATTDTR